MMSKKEGFGKRRKIWVSRVESSWATIEPWMNESYNKYPNNRNIWTKNKDSDHQEAKEYINKKTHHHVSRKIAQSKARIIAVSAASTKAISASNNITRHPLSTINIIISRRPRPRHLYSGFSLTYLYHKICSASQYRHCGYVQGKARRGREMIEECSGPDCFFLSLFVKKSRRSKRKEQGRWRSIILFLQYCTRKLHGEHQFSVVSESKESIAGITGINSRGANFRRLLIHECHHCLIKSDVAAIQKCIFFHNRHLRCPQKNKDTR